MQVAIKTIHAKQRGVKSHYQFKNWCWSEHGKRLSPQPVIPMRREDADLVNTCYANRATGTKTLYSLVWDLDAHRADERWLSKTGKLEWPLIRNFLTQHHPDLM